MINYLQLKMNIQSFLEKDWESQVAKTITMKTNQ